MRMALLGGDPESLALAQAAVTLGHDISWAGDVDPAERTKKTWLPAEDSGDVWEDLFDPATADAIIVGRGSAPEELRARQVQALVKLARPLIAVHPLFSSVLTYFEVDMARGECAGVLEHYNPLAASPAADRLSQWVRNGHPQLGAVEQIVATRTLHRRSRPEAEWHFARDVELLARIAGPLDRLGAHAFGGETEGDEPDYSALAVQLSGKGPVPVRWHIEPPAPLAELRITLICDRGKVQATFDESACRSSIEQIDANGVGEISVVDGDVAAQVVERFAVNSERGGPATTWPAALRAMEMADTIEIALRRKRMIEVHHQELTEQLAFKGTMAALGCGVLAALVPAVIVVGIIAGRLGAPVGQFVPHMLLGILAIFLGLQLLPRLIYPKLSPNADDKDGQEIDSIRRASPKAVD